MNALIEKAANVVFDIGNVLLRFDPDFLLPRLVPGLLDGRLTLDMLYGNPLWDKLDLGVLSEEDMAREAARLAGDESLWPQVLPAITRYHELMEPMPAVDLIPKLHAMGKKVYVLSNYGPEPFARTERRFAGLFAQLDGMVISGHEKIGKPDPAIFRLLLSRYGLNAADCVFIDDRAANVEGAKAVGMKGIVYTGVEAIA